MKATSALLGSLFLVSLCGCEEEKAEAPKEAAVEAAVPEAAPAKEEPAPAEEEAGPDAAARAEAAKEQAEIDANPLTECCRALGKQAFTLRSPEFHGASKVCGEALTAKKDLSQVLSEIKKELKDKALPSECSSK